MTKMSERPTYPSEGIVHQTVLRYAEAGRGTRVIDIGCGGSTLAARAESRGCEVVRLDKRRVKGLAQADGPFILCDILEADALDLSNFEGVFLSLVTLYIPRSKLPRLWQVIHTLTKRNAWIVAVDIHPASKVRASVPWRMSREPAPQRYWDTGRVRSELRSGVGRGTVTQYWHHTLADLMSAPLAKGFRLERIVEFPSRWKGIPVDVPAYLLSKWRRNDHS